MKEKVDKKRNQILEQKHMNELRECTFSPKIDHKSKLIAERERFNDRVEDILITKG